MTPVSLVSAFVAHQRGGSLSPWEAIQPLLRDLPGDTDVLAAIVEGSYLCKKLQEAVSPGNFFLHTVAHPSVSSISDNFLSLQFSRAADDTRVALGASDINVVAPPLPWPISKPVERTQIRSLDTLYSTSHRPGLIVIDDVRQSAVSVLSGARELLRRHSAAIFINLALSPPAERWYTWEALVSLLEGMDYVWCDAMLFPCATPRERQESVEINVNTVICALHRSAFQKRIPADAVKSIDSGASALSILAWNDWSINLPFDELRHGPLSLQMDNSLPCLGWHSAESGGSGQWWRWSGPTAHSRIKLPIPSVGTWILTFEVLSWGVAKSADAVQVYINGKRMLCEKSGDGFARYSPFTVGKRDDVGSIDLDVVTPSPKRASDDDPREIGICVMKCLLTRRSAT